MILAGDVLVEDTPATKPGLSYPEDAEIRLRSKDHPYVSRGALKLVAALDHFGIDPAGRVGLDVGASTGGFTQVLLLRGATRVHALDVGKNQLDWKIRSDPRVVVYEGVNARALPEDFFGAGQRMGIIVIDVSFISLTKVLPAVSPLLDTAGDLVTLIKPQFEVGPEGVGKGGIVTSSNFRDQAVQDVRASGEAHGLRWQGLIESPITGMDGNIEFLAHWKSERPA